MANHKNIIATTVPLSSLDGEDFYTVIIQEERASKLWNTVWLFRKGYEVALCCSSKIAVNDDPTMTVDGIKTMDTLGQFDESKKELAEMV